MARAASGAALVVEVGPTSLDQLAAYREQGLGTTDAICAWRRELRDLLLEPPTVAAE